MKRRIFDRNNSYTVAWGFVESKDGLIESPQVCKGYRFQDTEIRGISAFQGPFAWIIYSSKRLHEKKKNGNLPGILRYHAISLRLVRNSCNFQSRLNLKILRSEKPTATYHLNLFLCIFRNSVKLSKNLLPSKHLQHRQIPRNSTQPRILWKTPRTYQIWTVSHDWTLYCDEIAGVLGWNRE